MGNLTDWFNRDPYVSTYNIGDSVFGHWNRIPFVGTVGNDRVINYSGPEVTVHLDLPIRFENQVYNVVVVKHKDIKEYR